MNALQRPMTYDDLFDMPDDGMRRELIGGELIVNPSPRRDHQFVSSNIHLIVQPFLRATGAGQAVTHPVDVYVGPNDVVQPDLIAIRQDRLDIYLPEGRVIEPPDLIVEIISPSSQRIDRVRKMALYARFGVPEYWIVDPETQAFDLNSLVERVYASVPIDADGLFSSRIFPGLRIDPTEVFYGLDR